MSEGETKGALHRHPGLRRRLHPELRKRSWVAQRQDGTEQMRRLEREMKDTGGKTDLDMCTELICCHTREQEEQDLSQIGQTRREEEHSTRGGASTTTGEEAKSEPKLLAGTGLAEVVTRTGLAEVVTRAGPAVGVTEAWLGVRKSTVADTSGLAGTSDTSLA